MMRRKKTDAGFAFSKFINHTVLTRNSKTFTLYRLLIADHEKSQSLERSTALDMSKCKAKTRARRESEIKKWVIEKHRHLLENIPGIIYTADTKGSIDFLLPSKLLSITGFTSEEIAALPNGWVSVIHPDDRARYLLNFEKILCKKLQPWTINYRIVTKAGAEKWVEDRISPALCSTKDEAGLDGILLDINEKIVAKAEKKELETRLRQCQRIKTIGILAGGIAHDLNNILTPIMGYAEMLKQLAPPGTRAQEYIQEILNASERAKQLVEQISAFSGKDGSAVKEPFNLATVIAEVLQLIRPSIPSTITIHKKIDPYAGHIYGNASQMHQVLVNLCTNAYQAMEHSGGTLEIRLESVIPDDKTIELHSSLTRMRYIRLAVSDTGTGMDKKTVERIFELFFTTKPAKKGTGLGLYIVHDIVTRHKGVITVSSLPGKGSTFEIYLPPFEGDSQQKPSLIAGNARSEREGTILFVDDERATVNMMKAILEENGYMVTATTSASEALNALKKNPTYFDLLITDLSMPEMNGIALASEACLLNPQLPVILLTGCGGSQLLPKCLDKHTIHKLLIKPVRLNVLLEKILQLVGRQRPQIQ